MSLVHNERVKLTATALNNTAIATIVAGLIAPAASFLYGVTIPSQRHWWLIALAWLAGGVALHIVAGSHCGGLRP